MQFPSTILPAAPSRKYAVQPPSHTADHHMCLPPPLPPFVQKRSRKKKARKPKGFDPALPNGGLPPPDPERWLPKWQRSDFKKKKATSAMRRAGEVVKGSQGAGKVDENLDRSKAAPAPPKDAQPSKPSLPTKKKKGRK
eukprot:363611-Chlamydomonas_euryale.AAC.17